jgi:hypothetical protein
LPKKEDHYQKYRSKKPVFVLPKAIAQDADEPQKRNASEGHNVQS